MFSASSSLSSTTPRLAATVSRTIHLVPAGMRLWRAVDPSGRIVGHVRQWQDAAGTRFRAQRYSAAAKAFRDLGDFWSVDDALACVASSR